MSCMEKQRTPVIRKEEQEETGNEDESERGCAARWARGIVCEVSVPGSQGNINDLPEKTRKAQRESVY